MTVTEMLLLVPATGCIGWIVGWTQRRCERWAYERDKDL
jgi:hypothetical protein